MIAFNEDYTTLVKGGTRYAARDSKGCAGCAFFAEQDAVCGLIRDAGRTYCTSDERTDERSIVWVKFEPTTQPRTQPTGRRLLEL